MVNINEDNCEKVKSYQHIAMYCALVKPFHLIYRKFSKDYSQCVYKLLKEWNILLVKSLFTETLLPETACKLARIKMLNMHV